MLSSSLHNCHITASQQNHDFCPRPKQQQLHQPRQQRHSPHNYSNTARYSKHFSQPPLVKTVPELSRNAISKDSAAHIAYMSFAGC
jgi:hypothetical protein